MDIHDQTEMKPGKLERNQEVKRSKKPDKRRVNTSGRHGMSSLLRALRSLMSSQNHPQQELPTESVLDLQGDPLLIHSFQILKG